MKMLDHHTHHQTLLYSTLPGVGHEHFLVLVGQRTHHPLDYV